MKTLSTPRCVAIATVFLTKQGVARGRVAMLSVARIDALLRSVQLFQALGGSLPSTPPSAAAHASA